ncbi:MAG: ABC transporter permease [Bacteroidales bacterium]|mgnify:CR=1 FL=1|nr:ABC transporter permease [Bacteroidales bacterium]
MKPVFFIAKRYLFAKKSHNVINVISIISAAGIAIGCAALVIILSVYNGFDSLVKDLYEDTAADFVVIPAKGKVFSPSSNLVREIASLPEVASCTGVLEENVFLKYDDNTAMAVVRGVDTLYPVMSMLPRHLVDGKFELKYGSINQAVAGRLIAASLGIGVKFVTPLELYFPSRTEKVSVLDPMASLRSIKVFPAGILSVDQNFDKKYLYVPIDALRTLLEYEEEVSYLEIRTASDISYKKTGAAIASLCGDDFVVKDRYQQNDSLYKLLVYEKLAIYVILLFVMLVIACNIFGSLKMLRIEKEDDMEILRAMGADNDMIKAIFRTEGWLISLSGIVVGVVVGIAVCLLQMKFGFVKMPGNFIVDAYPVVLRGSDILLTLTGVALICGLLPRIGRIR